MSTKSWALLVFLSVIWGGSFFFAAVAVRELPPLVVETPEQRLAAALPTFYAGRLLDPRLSLDASVLRALLDNGIPPEARRQLEGAAQLTPPVANLYARGLVELGMRYFRPGDFSRAAEVAAQEESVAGSHARRLERQPGGHDADPSRVHEHAVRLAPVDHLGVAGDQPYPDGRRRIAHRADDAAQQVERQPELEDEDIGRRDAEQNDRVAV